MIKNKEKKCKIILPDSETAINYRQRLLHHIIAKFLGARPVFSTGTEIHFTGTPDQEVIVQSIIDTCTEELDDLVQSIVYSALRKKGLLAAKDIEINIKVA